MTAITLTFWNKWVPVRKEQYADGSTSIFFGFGRLTWRPSPSPMEGPGDEPA